MKRSNYKVTIFIGYNYTFAIKDGAKMVGKTQKKAITALAQKKYRDKTGLFVAEGPKLVIDLYKSGISPCRIFTTDKQLGHQFNENIDVDIISNDDLRKMSFLKNPQTVLGLFQKPQWNFLIDSFSQELTLCLDGIQDPGNMGTILRVADWFGFKSIVCSTDSVDVFNPKVVQASMGAIGRVKIHYTNLPEFCQQCTTQLKLPVFGTFMDGENIYQTKLPDKGLIITGNEGNGIRPETETFVTTRLAIPRWPKPDGSQGMESLNAGVATAIVCSEFKRSLL